MSALAALRIHLHRQAVERGSPVKAAPLARRDTTSRHNRVWSDAELAALDGAATIDEAWARLPGRTRNAVAMQRQFRKREHDRERMSKMRVGR